MTPLTDILIPLGLGSRQKDLELRYCLRSIEKHLAGVGNVWVVGERPEWLQNVVHVPCEDSANNWNRARNIYNKIVAGIIADFKIPQKHGPDDEFTLSDDFLYMNDDHYLLTDYQAGAFPYYHRGPVNLDNHKQNLPQLTQYQNTLTLFDTFLPYDFGVHCPVLFNKNSFHHCLPGGKWPQYGYEIKTAYCNMDIDLLTSIKIDDMKFQRPAMAESIYQVLADRPWFSVGDACLKSGGMLQVLAELYSNKSKYENSWPTQ